MIKIIEVEHVSDYRLRLRFENGVEGEVDIATQISFEGVFKPMRDLAFFKRVRINKTWGTIEWPGRIDFAPEVLYEEITRRMQIKGKKETFCGSLTTSASAPPSRHIPGGG